MGSLLRNDKSIRPNGLKENQRRNDQIKRSSFTLFSQIWVIQEFLQE
jgi:hypothetical protein